MPTSSTSSTYTRLARPIEPLRRSAAPGRASDLSASTLVSRGFARSTDVSQDDDAAADEGMADHAITAHAAAPTTTLPRVLIFCVPPRPGG
jgi:hypothetical protein